MTDSPVSQKMIVLSIRLRENLLAGSNVVKKSGVLISDLYSILSTYLLEKAIEVYALRALHA